MLTRSLSYGVTALLQSLDCLRGGSILAVLGVVRFPVFAHAVEKMGQSRVVQSTTAPPECCDWLVYWSVQSVRTAVLAPNFLCVMSLYLSRIAHVELEELMSQSLIVQTTAL